MPLAVARHKVSRRQNTLPHFSYGNLWRDGCVAVACHSCSLNQTPTEHPVANLMLGVAECGHEPNIPLIREEQSKNCTKLIFKSITTGGLPASKRISERICCNTTSLMVRWAPCCAGSQFHCSSPPQADQYRTYYSLYYLQKSNFKIFDQ